jgi:hypothetical protein
MKNKTDYVEQIAEIRRIMEKSSKFMSLSGFSGIIIGCYALAAAYLVREIIVKASDSGALEITVIAAVLLAVSLATAFYLTLRRSKRMNQKIWGPGSKQLLSVLLLPLLAGGTFAVIMLIKGIYGLIAPTLLVFYGLSLAAAARYSHRELLFMGLTQIFLGLLAAWLQQSGLLLWAAGFGAVHIIYGAWMFMKYERTSKNPES